MNEPVPRGSRLFSWPPLRRAAFPFRFAIAAVLILVLAAVVAGRLITLIAGPSSSYKVWVIGNFTNSASHRKIREGTGPQRPFAGKIDGLPVVIEITDDRGDPATARMIAEEVSRSTDTLMVIGHMSSTTTKAAISVYQAARPPVPVILTSETNPHLAPPAQQHQLYPLMRLAPTDKIQARDAAEFAMNRGATSFWVVQDTHNPVYADYLAREFIRVVQAARKSVLLSTTTTALPSVETIRAMDIRCVFFAGEWTQALILIRQAKKIYDKTLDIILLSDAAAEEDLIKQGGADVEGVYLMNPLTATQYKHERGYELYGRDARLLAQAILDETSSTFKERLRQARPWEYWYSTLLGLRRAGVAREVAGKVIRGFPESRDEFGNTDFVPRDISELAIDTKRFHAWQIRDGRFTDVDQNGASVKGASPGLARRPAR